MGEDHPRKGNSLERVDPSRSPPHLLRKDDRLRDAEERERYFPPNYGLSDAKEVGVVLSTGEDANRGKARKDYEDDTDECQ